MQNTIISPCGKSFPLWWTFRIRMGGELSNFTTVSRQNIFRQGGIGKHPPNSISNLQNPTSPRVALLLICTTILSVGDLLKKVCDQFLRNLCMRQIWSTLDKYPLTQFDKCINFMCYLEENSSEVLILLARGSLPVDLFKANGAQILYLSLFAIAWLSASTFLLYHFKFVPKIAIYKE